MVTSKCKPVALFKEYLEKGYYPFLLEGEGEYYTKIEQVVNYIIETDDKCDQMTLTVTLRHGTSVSVSPVTVTLKSFIKDQPKKTKEDLLSKQNLQN